MKDQRLGSRAKEVADEMLRATEGTGDEHEPLAEDDSRRRVISPELRLRFIEVRTSMHRMGLVDPVLNHFDSYTVAQPTSRQVAERLAEFADAIGGDKQ
ncbi:MAG: hypothetical protein KY432_02970 [Acidobacteria bacterium]|nr:hypothetical protein [Acidobacteriota bacterium]